MSTVSVTAMTYSPYTEEPTLPPGMIYPNHGFQILSTAVSLFGLSTLAYCFARRSEYEGIWTWKGLRDLPWPRLCVMLIFADSWAFIFSAGLLMSGAGLSTSVANCTLAIFSCIILYAGSKLFIYLFLIEKVYIVWAPRGSVRPARFKTPIFRVCIAMLLPLGAILIILIFGRIAELRASDRVCVIGLKKAASLSLLSYDLLTTAVLTSLFVYRLLVANVSARLKKVAARTLVASSIALATSCANVAILTILHGKELGWICLSSCGTDVTINAIAIYWVTNTQHVARAMPKESVTPPVTTESGGVSSVRVPAKVRSKHLSSAIGTTESVPAHILASRVTHFADDPSHSETDVRIEGPAFSSKGGWFGGLWRNKRSSHPEEHTMSVQVTVTTERQIPFPSSDDGKYDPNDSDFETDSAREPSKIPHDAV